MTSGPTTEAKRFDATTLDELLPVEEAPVPVSAPVGEPAARGEAPQLPVEAVAREQRLHAVLGHVHRPFETGRLVWRNRLRLSRAPQQFGPSLRRVLAPCLAGAQTDRCKHDDGNRGATSAADGVRGSHSAPMMPDLTARHHEIG